MTTFTRVWDATYETLPPDTGEAVSLGAGRIRDLKTDINEREIVDHSGAGDAHDGKHLKVTLKIRASDPTLESGDGALYSKTISSVAEVFYKDSSGNILQLTNAGGIFGLGSTIQAFDAGLLSIAGLTTAADKMIYTTGSDTYAVADLSSYARTLLDDTTAAAARTTLGVVIGTDVQTQDAGLEDISGLALTDGNIIIGNGSNWVAESGATARASLGLVIGTDVQTQDAQLDDVAGLAVTDGSFIVGDGANFVAESGETAQASMGLTDKVIATAVNFDGTLTDPITPRNSTNVDDVTKNATGDYTINFTSAIPADYFPAGLAGNDGSSTATRTINLVTLSTTSLRITVHNSGGNNADADLITLMIAGGI